MPIHSIMIEEIRGEVARKTPTMCVVDCGGVGIGLRISLNTFQAIEKNGVRDSVHLQTYLHVREDAGFAPLGAQLVSRRGQ